MAVQPYRDDELNYFKFTSIVLNEFPKALRHAFKTMWDNNIGHRPGFQLWDDSPAVGKLFVSTEGGRTKVPTRKSYNEWDCTALFQATIYAQTFALHHRTLSDLYVKPRSVPHGSFHASVVSPGGNSAETFALAIDQLRLLRNSVCHSTGSQMDKVTFHQCVQHARDAFSALGLKTDPIDAIGSLTESDFPTNEVRKLEEGIKAETRAYIKFLESVSSDIDELKALLIALKNDTANKKDIAMLEEKLSSDIDELRSSSATIEQNVEGMLERKISELKKAQQEGDVETNASGNKLFKIKCRR